MLSKQPYGVTAGGDAVTEYTLANSGGVEVKIITYGGVIASVLLPDRGGQRANVVLGCANLADYETKSKSIYFGCITGRYANRIGGGKFMLEGADYQLDLNNGPATLHGGLKGFDKVVWDVTQEIEGDNEAGIELHYLSPDGDQHFPGALDTTVTYLLNDRNELHVEYRATTDKTTHVNLTNHTYWNLAGEGSGPIYDHVLQLNADLYTPVDANAIPFGPLEPVEGTPFDFRTPTPVGARIRLGDQQLAFGKGYDHNWALARPNWDDTSLMQAAVVRHEESGRVLEVWTSEPGIQFYSGNFLDASVYGSSGRAYRQGEGMALETQHFPDSPNQPAYPSTALRPGEIYQSTTLFKFGVQ